ncbi:AAA domain-containing protein [Bacillus sp. CGMCC 1.16607]|uniref:AAA domain-containing protein n=1 Tax=Bacillus sp. CGMCC 1.16607 TaxID=3351842 RepID=UPI00362A4F83
MFQYTSTPHIYDPNIFFKIDRFIVPKRITDDYPGRKMDETLFIFPFDHTERGPAEAYEDISEKLRSLDYPLVFLANLGYISFEIQAALGLYGKHILDKQQFGDTVAERICLTQNDGDEIYDDNLWLFSRKDSNGHSYSVGFFLDKKENLTPKQHPSFCFFPTKEVTNLNFIIHAPFLLTDSREGIRAGIQHNKDMIEMLADLAADSLVYLRDIGQAKGYRLINDEIFDIIPYKESDFNDVNDKRKISFRPFYIAIKEKMCSGVVLIPTSDGYTSKQNAYLVEYSQWASNCLTTDIFTNFQLAVLSGNAEAKWAFFSLSRAEVLRNNKPLAGYLDSISNDWFGQDKFIARIDSAFIEMQTIEWLHEFYKYISASKERIKLVQKKPILLNQAGKAVSVMDEKGQPILFLPSEDVSGYETVNKSLMDNEDTVEFIRSLGLKEPSLRDEIYNIILPQYQGDVEIDTNPHFRKFFNYYKECPQSEIEDYLELIRDCEFVSFRSADDDTVYRGKASDLYLPSESLCQWFQYKPDTRFVDLDEYIQLVGEHDKKDLISFLIELGAKEVPKVLSRDINYQEAMQISQAWSRSTGKQKWTEPYIDGYREILEHASPYNAVFIWKQLLNVISSVCTRWDRFDSVLSGTYEYFYRYSRKQSFESSAGVQLRTIPWLLNAEGNLVSARELTLKTLSPQYETNTDEAKELLLFLGIEEELDAEEDEYLNEEQRAKIALAEALSDIPPEELKRFAEQYRATKQTSTHQPKGDEGDTDSENPTVTRIAKEISKRAVSATKAKEITTPTNDEANLDSDEDDYTKPSIDFSKKIDQAKQRSAKEIAVIAHLDELTQKAINADRYSFGWFKALLELESVNTGENTANSREISITFSKVEREEGTSRTLILKHPSRYIPQSMEDLADIPLELHFANQPMVKVAVEVVNVKSYTLRAKLRTNAQIDGVDLSLVTEARIEAKNPVFLLEELRKAFNNLNLDDDYDMQSNLCKNIEFVFGPPGTGKTTHLAGKVILPLMQADYNTKILVLTPTNKAADVLVRRLMELDTNHSYTDWLVRFGATNDSVIEQSGVFRDKTFDIRTFPRNVTVTTIARFPYDYFLPDGDTRLHLNALKWDYIIIDEASMIPMVNIVYPLYK